MQAKKKMKARASQARSSSDARGGCDDASTAMEEGHTDKTDAGDKSAVPYRAKKLSVAALITEMQKLTSLMVKVSLSSSPDSSPAYRVGAPVVGIFRPGLCALHS